MNIQVPSEKEYKRQKSLDRRNFVGGILFGIIFFGLVGTRVFRYGFENVAVYTWIALAFGVISFGFLAKWFASEFWQRILSNH